MNIVPTTSQEREDATRVEQVAKKQKEYKLIGKQRKVAGHTLFEFNKKTKELSLLTYTVNVVWSSVLTSRSTKQRLTSMRTASICRHSMSRTPKRNYVN